MSFPLKWLQWAGSHSGTNNIYIFFLLTLHLSSVLSSVRVAFMWAQFLNHRGTNCPPPHTLTPCAPPRYPSNEVGRLDWHFPAKRVLSPPSKICEHVRLSVCVLITSLLRQHKTHIALPLLARAKRCWLPLDRGAILKPSLICGDWLW